MRGKAAGTIRITAGEHSAISVLQPALKRFLPDHPDIKVEIIVDYGLGDIVAAGYDADFTIVDLKRSETITNKWVASKAGWTPYDGVRVTGWPVGTFIRGRRVMWQGELVTPSQGEPVRFLETLKA